MLSLCEWETLIRFFTSLHIVNVILFKGVVWSVIVPVYTLELIFCVRIILNDFSLPYKYTYILICIKNTYFELLKESFNL